MGELKIRLSGVEARLDAVEGRLENVETAVRRIYGQISGLWNEMKDHLMKRATRSARAETEQRG